MKISAHFRNFDENSPAGRIICEIESCFFKNQINAIHVDWVPGNRRSKSNRFFLRPPQNGHRELVLKAIGDQDHLIKIGGASNEIIEQIKIFLKENGFADSSKELNQPQRNLQTEDQTKPAPTLNTKEKEMITTSDRNLTINETGWIECTEQNREFVLFKIMEIIELLEIKEDSDGWYVIPNLSTHLLDQIVQDFDSKKRQSANNSLNLLINSAIKQKLIECERELKGGKTVKIRFPSNKSNIAPAKETNNVTESTPLNEVVVAKPILAQEKKIDKISEIIDALLNASVPDLRRIKEAAEKNQDLQMVLNILRS